MYAAPLDDLPAQRDVRSGELRFDCGTARYHLYDHGPSGSTATHSPDRALLEMAAARLIPGLYCTAGPSQFAAP